MYCIFFGAWDLCKFRRKPGQEVGVLSYALYRRVYVTIRAEKWDVGEFIEGDQAKGNEDMELLTIDEAPERCDEEDLRMFGVEVSEDGASVG